MLALLAAAGLQATQLDYVPFSDTAEYADCVLDAVRFADPGRLVCADHPTFVYLGLLALPQLAFFGSPTALLATNFVLACTFALYAVGPVTRLVGTDGLPARLALLALVVQPLVAVGWVQFSADTGLMLFTLPFLWELAAGRTGRAALLGLALAGCKETGWLLVAAAAAASVWMRRGQGPAQVVRGHLPLIAPGLLVLAWFGVRGVTAGEGEHVLWHGLGAEDILATARDGKAAGLLATLLVNVGVLQFLWIAVPFAFLSLRQRLPRAWAGSEDSADRFIGLVAAALLVVPVLSVLPILHGVPRYTAFLVPPLLLVALDGLTRWSSGGRARVVGPAVMAALWLLSCFRTADPVSRAVFGTFPFGRHELLYMTSLAKDWPGPGEDQLAYNFEILYIPRLVDRALRDLRPPEGALLVLPPEASWRVVHRVDRATHGRTLQHDGAYTAQVLGEVVNPFGELDATWLYGLCLPNADGANVHQMLGRLAPPGVRVLYELGGYSLEVHLANEAAIPG